jgi:uncharacterized protein (UPF0297 family)
MKKDAIQKLLASGDPTVVSIDPDTKTEISRRKIDGIIQDMKKHLLQRKKVHIVLIRE